MCTSIAASCAVILDQQRAQMMQRLRDGGHVSIAPRRPAPKNCTVIEHGQIVVKPVQDAAAAE